MHEIRMPQLGQSVEEASIVLWPKKEGEPVREGDPLFSIQTDKAEIECESTASGVLRKILLQPDAIVPVLTVVALVGAPDEALPDLSRYGLGGAASPLPPQPETSVVVEAAAVAAPDTRKDGGRAAVSPRARAKAKQLGVDAAQVAGTGVGSRVIEADVLAYADRAATLRVTPTARRVAAAKGVDIATVHGSGPRGKITKADVLNAGAPTPAARAAQAAPGTVRRIPLTPMRRIIAERMAKSKYSAPHYYMTVEVDMSAAKAFRATVTAFKLSVNDLALRATIQTLREFPNVNARWAGDAIEEVADINLGVAVALPAGLIVPVLKQAQNLPLEALASQCRTLVEKARAGKLLPDDFTGNTFTVSNLARSA